MIVALGGNDALRGIDPAVARANIEGILAAAQSADVETLLVGIEAPGNFGPDYKRDFDAIYPELAAQYGVLHAGNFLGPLAAAAEGGATLAEYMQPDGLHPSEAGVRLIVDALGPKVLELAQRID